MAGSSLAHVYVLIEVPFADVVSHPTGRRMIDPNQVPRGEDPQTTDKQPVDPSQTRREQTGRLERFALFITNAVGTIGFFFVVLAWTLGWLLFNSFAPKPYRFDPYPAFVLWLFISEVGWGHGTRAGGITISHRAVTVATTVRSRTTGGVAMPANGEPSYDVVLT